MKFEWDKNKAAENLRKHGVSFDEASEVFYDPLGSIFNDEEHSDEELREIVIGHTYHHRLLLVSFTERPHATRIISARPVTVYERKDYEDYAL